jgi:hypothetical protein
MAPHIPEIQHGVIEIECPGGDVVLDEALGDRLEKTLRPGAGGIEDSRFPTQKDVLRMNMGPSFAESWRKQEKLIHI